MLRSHRNKQGEKYARQLDHFNYFNFAPLNMIMHKGSLRPIARPAPPIFRVRQESEISLSRPAW